MNSIVLNPLLNSLAIQNPAVFDVSPQTMAKYRAMAGIANKQYASQHQAQLLIAALLYRPRTELDLAIKWGQNRDEVVRWFVLGLSKDTIEITREVAGENLRQAIFEATLIQLKCDDTLQNYAKELSDRSGKEIRFHKSFVFDAATATAFARLAVEKRQIKKQVGYRTAFKRWGYVPDVQLQAI